MREIKFKPSSWDRSAKRKALRAVLFFVPALVYLPVLGGKAAFPPGPGTYTDLLVTHYPNLLFLRDSLFIHHQLPLWTSLIHSGAPFAANPLSGLFYLPGWAALAFPLPAGLTLVLAGHVVFGTWGMYRFLRLEEVNEAGSVLGALVFGLMPKLAAHFGAGHVSLIYAISWTPWLLSCSKSDRRGWQTGLTAGMLFLADPRWSIYAGLLWLVYDVAYRQMSVEQRIWLYLKAVLIAFLVAAPLIIPMAEYIGQATRAELTSVDLMLGSMPASQLVGVLIPGSGGNLEWYWYSGGSVLALVFAALFDKRNWKRNLVWIAIFCLGILFSFGASEVTAGWLSKIPVMNLVRVPARSLFLSGIALAVLVAKLSGQLTENENQNVRERKVSFGIFGFGALMALGFGLLTGWEPWQLIWGFGFLAICGLGLYLLHERLSSGLAAWILTLIVIIDLAGAGLMSYQIQEIQPAEQDPILTYLTQDEGYFRVYSPSYSLTQDQAAVYRLELADGIDPLQIARYAEYMEKATGVERAGYSVTIPPFSTGDPSTDNQDAVPASDLLGLLNVKYVVSDFDLDAPGLIQVKTENGVSLYRNELALPRAWIENPAMGQSIPGLAEIQSAAVVIHSPNRIVIAAQGPGKLILSEISYPGWKVIVDGKRVEIEQAYQVLRSVDLPEGDHEIQFVFQPLAVYGGLILSAAGWLVGAVLIGRKKK